MNARGVALLFAFDQVLVAGPTQPGDFKAVYLGEHPSCVLPSELQNRLSLVPVLDRPHVTRLPATAAHCVCGRHAHYQTNMRTGHVGTIAGRSEEATLTCERCLYRFLAVKWLCHDRAGGEVNPRQNWPYCRSRGAVGGDKCQRCDSTGHSIYYVLATAWIENHESVCGDCLVKEAFPVLLGAKTKSATRPRSAFRRQQWS